MLQVFVYLLMLIVSTQSSPMTYTKIWFEGESIPGTNWTIQEIPRKPNTQNAQKVISHGITKIALEFEKIAGDRDYNLIFAPLSVVAALAVVMLGSGGQTYNEIANFLGLLSGFDVAQRRDVVHEQLGHFFDAFENNPGLKLGTNLVFANGIFVQEGFPINPQYADLAKKIYRSDLSSLDFLYHADQAKHTINNWVSNRTQGRIKELINDSLDPSSKIVIANALYFHGDWEHPFPLTNIQNGKNFYVNDKEIVQVTMMHHVADVPYYDDKINGYKIFALPYKGGDLLMYFIVPNNLNKFMKTVTVASVDDLINKTYIQKILYFVPKMKLESSLELKRPMELLGIKTLFQPKLADLSGISEGLYASSIVHKVEIDITNIGTTATAATAVGLNRDGSTPTVKVDKPFLFFIYHKPTKSISFWGTVHNPHKI